MPTTPILYIDIDDVILDTASLACSLLQLRGYKVSRLQLAPHPTRHGWMSAPGVPEDLFTLCVQDAIATGMIPAVPLARRALVDLIGYGLDVRYLTARSPSLSRTTRDNLQFSDLPVQPTIHTGSSAAKADYLSDRALLVDDHSPDGSVAPWTILFSTPWNINAYHPHLQVTGWLRSSRLAIIHRLKEPRHVIS